MPAAAVAHVKGARPPDHEPKAKQHPWLQMEGQRNMMRRDDQDVPAQASIAESERKSYTYDLSFLQSNECIKALHNLW